MKIAIGFVAVTAALMSTSASAAIITFAGLPGSNGSAFTGPYVEAGYSVSAMAGQVFEGHQFGNPSPSLVVGTVFGSISTGTVQICGPQAIKTLKRLQNYRFEAFFGSARSYSG